MLNARRRVMSDGREAVERADLDYAFQTFIPSAQGLEKELQELVAVLECTDRDFLPEDWREKVDAPNGRSQMQRRLHVLREMIDTLL